MRNCGTEIETIFFLRCQFLVSEIQNLHDNLCLADPSVITFEEESL